MSKPLATSVVKFANEEWQLATTLRASLISHALRHMSHLNAFTVASTRHIDEMRGILFDVYDARLFDLHGDGNRFAAKIPMKLVHSIAAGIFAVMGVLTLFGIDNLF